MSLNVTIPDTFTGPLGLLLHLIRKEEMDIHDIPIAKLAAAYLEEIGKLAFINFDEGIEFLDLASTLLEIKSKMLLPPEERMEEGDEEEDGDFDPRAGLVQALLEYRRFKDAARALGDMAEEQARRFPRVAPRLIYQPSDWEDDSPETRDLFEAFQGMLFRFLPAEESSIIDYQEIPTSVRIEQIDLVLREAGRTRFSLLLSGRPDRAEMVDFFIAMLEMIRQGVLIARQADNFTDIVLERREPREQHKAIPVPGRRRRAACCFPAAWFPASSAPVVIAASPVFPPGVPGRVLGCSKRPARTAPRFFC